MKAYFESTPTYQRWLTVTTQGKSPWQNGSLVLQVNPLKFEKAEIRSNTWRVVNRGVNGTSSLSTWEYLETSGWGDTPFSWEPSVAADAAGHFRNHANTAQLNLALVLAERKKTVDLVTNRAMSLANAARHLRRGRWRSAAAALGIKNPRRPRSREFGSMWLEYQYGWKPLLADVQAACSYHSPLTFKVRGTASKTYTETVQTTKLGAQYICSEQRVYTYTVRHGADAVAGNPVASAQSLGLLDPLTLAWELIPFSFVVDWFLPVGTYLSQLTALNGLTLMNGFTSYTTDYSVNLSALRTRDQYPNDWFYDTTRQPPAGPFPAKVGFSGSSSRVVHRKQRGGLNLGGATPALPKFKNPLSLTHFLNAMALLAVSFRK